MFLFVVARQGIPKNRVDLPNLIERRVGDRVVSAGTDGWLSACDAGPGAVAVREHAPLARGQSAGPLLLAEARVTGVPSGPGAVELYKTLLSGRQVYYHFGRDGSVYCASHAGLLRAAGVALEEDEERLPELYLYRYVTPPRTPFKNVGQLLAGQRLRLEFRGERWEVARDERYVPPVASQGAAAVGGDYGCYGERNAAALRDSIAALRGPHERPRVLLSGGLDSSILFKLAHEELDAADTHSTTYPFKSQREDQDVEREYALSAADAMGARHRFFAPTLESYLRGVVESIAAAEEPVVHLQSVLMMLLFRDGLPHGRGTVVVGQGADGAYGLQLHGKVRRLEARARKYEPWQPVLTFTPALGALALASKTVGRAGGLVEAMRMRWRPDDPVDDPRHVLWWLGVTGDPKWVRRNFKATAAGANAERAALMRPYQGRSANDLISLLDFLGDVSVTQQLWSKMGEAAGKWVYYPFNWPGLLDAAFETPWDVKLAEPKGLLRGVARRVGVPEFIITRPKANFNAVPAAWGRPNGVFKPLVPLAAKVCDDRRLLRAGGDEWPQAYTLWTLLNHAIWRRLVIDGEPAHVLLEELERAASEVDWAEPIVA